MNKVIDLLSISQRTQFDLGLNRAWPMERYFVRKRLPQLLLGDESYAAKKLMTEGVEATSMMICAFGWLSFCPFTVTPGILLLELESKYEPLRVLGIAFLAIGLIAFGLCLTALLREAVYKARFIHSNQ